jgi:hypothetical protein
MKIKKNEITKIRDILLGSSLMDITNKNSALFFPLEIEEISGTTEEGVVLLEVKQEGSRSLVKTGLIVHVDDKGKKKVELALASTEYAPQMSLRSHLALTQENNNLSDKSTETLSSLDCLIVKKEQLLVVFKV